MFREYHDSVQSVTRQCRESTTTVFREYLDSFKRVTRQCLESTMSVVEIFTTVSREYHDSV